MKKFTKLWQLMLVLLLSTSVVMGQNPDIKTSHKKDVKTSEVKISTSNVGPDIQVSSDVAEKELNSVMQGNLTVEDVEYLRKQVVGAEAVENEETVNFVEEIIQSYSAAESNVFISKGLFSDFQMEKLEENGITAENLKEDNGAIEKAFSYLEELENSAKSEPVKPIEGTDAVATYSFSQSAGSFTLLTGADTLINGTTSMDSWVSGAVTIPTFVFDGVAYTTCFISSNGFITLGGTAPSAFTYTAISSTTGSGIALAPFSADLNDNTNTNASNICWEIVGTEVVFQWTQIERYAAGENFDMQVRMDTVSGVVEFVYQLNSGPGTSTSYQPQVGIRTSTTDYVNRLVSTGAEDWATSLPGTANNNTCRFTAAVPAKNFTTGLTYTFTPPAAGTPLPPTNPSPADAAGDIAVAGTLTWDFGTDTDTYDLWFGPTGSMAQVVTGATAGATGSYPFTGLSNSTEYSWQVIAHNGALTTNGPVWSFTTLIAAPYAENFTGGYPAAGWTEGTGLAPAVPVLGSSLWLEDGFANNGTTGSAKLNIYSTNRDEWFFTPLIDLGTGSFNLTFDIALTDYANTNPPDSVGDDDKFAVYISTDNFATYTPLQVWDNTTTPALVDVSVTGENIVFDLSGYSGVVQVGFYGESTVSNTDNDFFVDNVAFVDQAAAPDCATVVAPADLATDITLAGSLQWNSAAGANGYYISFGTDNPPTTIENGTDIGNVLSYAFSGLSYSTTYYWQIVPYNGVGSATGCSIWSFTTMDDPTITSTPHCEYFDSSVEPVIPNGWTGIISNTTNTFASVETSDTYSNSPLNSVYIYNSSADTAELLLVSPPIDIVSVDLATQQVKFMGRGSTSGYPIEVGTMSDPMDAGTFTLIESVNLDQAAFVEHAVYLTSWNGTDAYLAFRHGQASTYNSVYLDDICIEDLPACLAPINVTVGSITESTATVTWTPQGSENDWYVEVGAPGFTPGTGNELQAYTKHDDFPFPPISQGLTGLTSATPYEVYVQAACDLANDTSAWVGPVPFTTDCPIYTSFPFTEGFEDAMWPPLCWSSFEWYQSSYGSPNTGLEFAYSNTAGSMLTTPLFAFADDYTLDFYYRAESVNYPQELAVLVSTDGINFPDTVFHEAGIISTTYLYEAIDLAAYNGEDTVVIQFVGLYGTGGFDYGVLVDDVSIYETPDCFPPTALGTGSLASDMAELVWTSLSGTSNVEWDTAGFVQGTGNMELAVTSPFMIGPLMPETSYSFYVQDVCGVPTSTWAGPFTFTTYCALDCPIGGVAEAEACGDDTNGGCNSAVVNYEPVPVSGIVCGTTWADTNFRDTDWFEYTLAAPGNITFAVTGQAATLIGFVGSTTPGYLGCTLDCEDPGLDFIASTTTTACEPDTLLIEGLDAGTYYFWVGLPVFVGYPCEVKYVAEWTTTPYTPEPGEFCSNALPAAVGVTVDALQPSWYMLAGSDEMVTVTSCIDGQSVDTYLQIWDGCCGNLIVENDDATCASSGLSSTAEFFAELGTTYYIHWADEYNNDTIDFEIFSGLPVININSPLDYNVTLVQGGNSFDEEIVQNLGDDYTLAVNEATQYVIPGILFTETFDTEIPATWSQVMYSGTGSWMHESTYAGEFIGTDGNYAEADSDQNNTDVFDVGLFTPALDLTGYSTIYIDYDRNFQDYAGDGLAEVRTYSGGTALINQEEVLWTQGVDDPVGGVHAQYMIDPSAYADPSDVYIEFYYSTEGGTFAWYFKIDNVYVTEFGYSDFTWITLDGGQSSAFDVAPLDEQAVGIGFDAAGLDPGTYYGKIMVNSNDPFNALIEKTCTLTVEAGVALDLKVYLEGPYDTTNFVMMTDLNDAAYLPLDQPYGVDTTGGATYYGNSSPEWLYYGTESVTAIPDTTVVDWVIVQLRDAVDSAAANPATVVAEQAAFLLEDGTIVGLDGMTRLVFAGVTPVNDLFAVIYHRNHLGVMSANPLAAPGGYYTYDFTTDVDQVFGGANGHLLVDVTSGIWGMVAADGDADGSVLPSDKTGVWLPDNNLTGYRGGDYDLNGTGQPGDLTNLWLPNSNSAGQVPLSKGEEVKGYQSQIPK